MEYMYILMVLNMKDIGRMINNMGMGQKLGKMVYNIFFYDNIFQDQNMKDSMKKGRKMDKVNIRGPKDPSMMEVGFKIIQMVILMGLIYIKRGG